MDYRGAAKLVDRSGEELELVLYKYDSCPFCVRVSSAINRLGLLIPTRDILEDPGAASELVEIGGKRQVPMMVINGKPLYESADIVRYLEREVRSGA